MPEPDETAVSVIGGTGALGFGLAVRLARAGVPVVIGSRDAGRAEEAAARAVADAGGGEIRGLENVAATAAARTVVLSVRFPSQLATLTNIRDALAPGALLIDATVPLASEIGGRATRTVGVWQGSAAQQTAEAVGERARVVSALHTVSAASLADPAHPLDQDVLLCGDSREDKAEAARLIERIDGLRCVDCGLLEMSRVTESLTAMLIAVNSRYKAHAGIVLAGLPDGLWR